MKKVPGKYRPPRPNGNHARNFELAIDDALNTYREEFGETIDAPQSLGEAQITLFAGLTARNPVDIDYYRVELTIP